MKEQTGQYIDFEESTQRRPAEIYRIWRVGGTNWYYTSGDTPVVYNGNTYEPAVIERSAVTRNAELEVTTLKINVHHLQQAIVDFISMNPVEILWVSVHKLFRDQDPYEASTLFLGQIKTVVFQGLVAEVECVGFEHFFRQVIPIYRYQPQCNNHLFDAKCTLVKSVYKTTAMLSSVSSNYLVVSSAAFGALADNWFSLGHLEWGDYIRPIAGHVGNNIALRFKLVGISAGQTVDVYPGCNLSMTMCRDKFNNVLNFFGHPYIPIHNPVLWR